MKIITKPITRFELNQIAKERFGHLTKAVIDIQKKIMVVDAELHADQEQLLLKNGSDQQDLWGINLYPEIESEDWIEFDSMINLRPSQNNFSRNVDDPHIRNTIINIVNSLIQK